MDPITIDRDVRGELARQGFAWIPRAAWSIGPEFEPHWQRLARDGAPVALDRPLKNGATFGRRRYGRSSWSPAGGTLQVLPHEPYYQSRDENAYAGGIMRQFA